MYVDYRILTIKEAREIIYHLFMKCDQPLRFSFDMRKKATLSQREDEEWYSITYVDVDEKHIVIFTSEDTDDKVEAYVTHSRADCEQRFTEYCQKHNPKFDGRICVDIADWVNKEQRYYEVD